MFLTILELNWKQRLGHKKTKFNICYHMFTSSTQLQNRSFHFVERTRTSSKRQKMKNARAKCAKILFFIVKYANVRGFLSPSSSWLLKLPKGLAKLGNIVAETMFLVMFPGVAKLGNICFGRKICVWEAKVFLTPWQKRFLFLSSKICFRNTCFPRG